MTKLIQLGTQITEVFSSLLPLKWNNHNKFWIKNYTA